MRRGRSHVVSIPAWENDAACRTFDRQDLYCDLHPHSGHAFLSVGYVCEHYKSACAVPVLGQERKRQIQWQACPEHFLNVTQIISGTSAALSVPPWRRQPESPSDRRKRFEQFRCHASRLTVLESCDCKCCRSALHSVLASSDKIVLDRLPLVPQRLGCRPYENSEPVGGSQTLRTAKEHLFRKRTFKKMRFLCCARAGTAEKHM